MRFLLLFALVLVGCQSSEIPPLPSEMKVDPSHPVKFAQVKPILDSRCIACHSCMESPCQLNLQSWDGVMRGAFHGNVYDGSRLHAVAPTRLYEDAGGPEGWRTKGFFNVVNGGDDSLLLSVLRAANGRKSMPSTAVRDSLICPQSQKELLSNTKELAMPYGLPALAPGEQQLLAGWVNGGAHGEPAKLGLAGLPDSLRIEAREWEAMLNARDLKSRIVARYLFEHLYMAHLYFKSEPRTFLKLTRSASPCAEGIKPIATRRPNDDPHSTTFHYCLYVDPATIVYKNHMPYEIGAEKRAWIKQNFFGHPWKATQFPSFKPGIASNPLLAFGEIPVEARHRFLLENAQYEVMTFIKGPVCNGSYAVNSIQEQFYVFFTDPKKDLMVRDPKYARKVARELVLPGEFGEDPSLRTLISGYHKTLHNRAKAREQENLALRAVYPDGLPLDMIWDGDGHNDNAVLTVFRHDDNAKVVKGAKGDLSKTIFVLDYSTFERLVYDLAVNFDVFDNVSHQLLSRLYMDILRMDAEDMFLQFLPPGERLAVKNSWYRGLATALKLKVLEEKKFADIPNAITVANPDDAKGDIVRAFLFQRLSKRVRGEDDQLNWKRLTIEEPKDPEVAALRSIASRTDGEHGFPTFFPELSVLIIMKNGKPVHTYSLIRNREHTSLSWISDESGRLAPAEDTLTILPKVSGSYPNQFFKVDEKELGSFVQMAGALHSKGDFRALVKEFGVSRESAEIWRVYDFANAHLRVEEPIEAGVLDLSRLDFN